MKSRTLLYNLFVLLFASLVFNQLACNNASFEHDKTEKSQTAPNPDNPDDENVDEFDSGDSVRCSSKNRKKNRFCDRGDDKIADFVPVDSVDRPECRTVCKNDCCEMICDDIAKNPIKLVNLWLVVDSSLSFDGERVAVANAITYGMIASLRKQIPVKVSVIAAHAPSPGAYQGPVPADPETEAKVTNKKVFSSAPAINKNIFYRHSSEPISVTITPGMNKTQLQKAKLQLLSKLGNEMRESPLSMAKQQEKEYNYLPGLKKTWPEDGPHSGSDELGLRNLSDALDILTKKKKLSKDEGLIILMASDENDACTPHVSKGQYVWSHPTDEKEMFNWYCRGINVNNIYAKIKKYVGNSPYAVGAFVYTGQGGIPADAHPQASWGKGYTTLAAKAGKTHGVMIDLASSKKWKHGLADLADNMVYELAENINNSFEVYTDFGVYNSKNEKISFRTIKVKDGHYDMQVFVDGKQCSYDPDPVNHVIRPYDSNGKPIQKGTNLKIKYCLKDKSKK